MFIIRTKYSLINFDNIYHLEIILGDCENETFELLAFTDRFDVDKGYLLYMSENLEDVERVYKNLTFAMSADCIGYDLVDETPIYKTNNNLHDVTVRYTCRTCENEKCSYFKNRCWGDEYELNCGCYEDKERVEQGIKIHDRCIHSQYSNDLLDIRQAKKIEYVNAGRCEFPPYDEIIELVVDDKSYKDYDITYLKIDGKVIYEAKEQK